MAPSRKRLSSDVVPAAKRSKKGGGEKENELPRLGPIYLNDVISLLQRRNIEHCRCVSARLARMIKDRRAAGKLPLFKAMMLVISKVSVWLLRRHS